MDNWISTKPTAPYIDIDMPQYTTLVPMWAIILIVTIALTTGVTTAVTSKSQKFNKLSTITGITCIASVLALGTISVASSVVSLRQEIKNVDRYYDAVHDANMADSKANEDDMKTNAATITHTYALDLAGQVPQLDKEFAVKDTQGRWHQVRLMSTATTYTDKIRPGEKYTSTVILIDAATGLEFTRR